MSEEAEQLSTNSQAFDGRFILTVIICTLIADALRGVKWLPYPICISVAYYLVFIVGYWVGRRPALTFGRFTLRLTGYLIIFVAGLWAIPQLLAKVIWKPAAYAVPTLLVAVWSYWMQPLYPGVRERGRFSAWLLFSVVIALLYGWAMKSE